MVVVWCVQQVLTLEAAFSMSLSRVKTGVSGSFIILARRAHLVIISNRVMCCHPRSLIAACPESIGSHPRIAFANFSCVRDSFAAVLGLMGQKVSRCLTALKARECHIISVRGVVRLCLAARCETAQVRWFPILHRVSRS